MPYAVFWQYVFTVFSNAFTSLKCRILEKSRNFLCVVPTSFLCDYRGKYSYINTGIYVQLVGTFEEFQMYKIH